MHTSESSSLPAAQWFQEVSAGPLLHGMFLKATTQTYIYSEGKRRNCHCAVSIFLFCSCVSRMIISLSSHVFKTHIVSHVEVLYLSGKILKFVQTSLKFENHLLSKHIGPQHLMFSSRAKGPESWQKSPTGAVLWHGEPPQGMYLVRQGRKDCACIAVWNSSLGGLRVGYYLILRLLLIMLRDRLAPRSRDCGNAKVV